MTAASPARLSDATLARLPAGVARPAYDRQATRIGVVHLGIGAFHRAHQAVYLDDVLAHEPDWAICGVSLRSPDVRDALQPQDGLYALELLETPPRWRVIGAVREVLCAPDQPAEVLARLADPQVKLVTLTVTEKGYCLAGDTLDLSHPDIVADLAHPQAPASAIGYLVAGLALRRARGVPAYTVLSCDNLPDNGGKLRRACVLYAMQFDPALARWIDEQARFPRSMVDSITPASDDALRTRAADALGLADAWPVQREPYTQWVIEDDFAMGRPDWARVGVTLSGDIAGYDRAKLRLLNAPHSAMAYLGTLLGLESVADAMRHPALGPFIATLMHRHIVPNVELPEGMDATAYVDAILARFANPAVHHRLLQIAQDGSQKIPVRLLGTITHALAAGRAIDVLCLPVAGWLQFVRRQAQAGVPLADPLAARLADIGGRMQGNAATDVAVFVNESRVFGALAEAPAFMSALCDAYARVSTQLDASLISAVDPR
ncbi:mannitol dehydrogenase [Stenotrophomonas panacihumi]|uniref:Mannitol dehydrogenase n=1 Tax=Stenotrophomonas panacihumi TaxID=676599 RepID=A0A0R0AT77_9GAMM|nr:mannitol dehydrogenase family protein [Stenotrophomonas panacihumi]KRG47881.1 mannitol dehydrogenase [Stenotrophomonas panacihumi]PTN55726.1 mannitol dehydrogenase family protein [Stenotrophomonas panacihumi]